MDKYDEKAIELCEDQDASHHEGGLTCSLCRQIAQALREAAAEAFEEAAKFSREIGGISAGDKMDRKEIGKTKAAEFLANRYDEMSRALRNPAPSENQAGRESK